MRAYYLENHRITRKEAVKLLGGIEAFYELIKEDKEAVTDSFLCERSIYINNYGVLTIDYDSKDNENGGIYI
jgi:hypothetical protein